MARIARKNVEARRRIGRVARLVVAPLLAVAAALGCSEDEGGSSGASLCKAQAARECYGRTYDQCVEELSVADDEAREKGCSSEWSAALACAEDHPSKCESGRLVAADECAKPLLVYASCSDQGFVGCDDTDPCDQCTCARCPCDSACVDALVSIGQCYEGCSGSADFTVCLGACAESAPPAFKARTDCLIAAEAECAAECGAPPPVCDAGGTDCG